MKYLGPTGTYVRVEMSELIGEARNLVFQFLSRTYFCLILKPTFVLLCAIVWKNSLVTDSSLFPSR